MKTVLCLGVAAAVLLSCGVERVCHGRGISDDGKAPQYIVDKDAPPTYQCRGQIVSPHERYEIKPNIKAKTATIIAVVKKQRFTMDDVAINQPLFDGRVAHLNPGESDGSYVFHLSPDERWLFVERRASNHLFFGTLYHRANAADTRMAVVPPYGTRLDEAAVEIYARQHHLSAHKIGGGSRYTNFEKWDPAHQVLRFTVAVAPQWTGSKKVCFAAYHFDSNRVTLEKED